MLKLTWNKNAKSYPDERIEEAAKHIVHLASRNLKRDMHLDINQELFLLAVRVVIKETGMLKFDDVIVKTPKGEFGMPDSGKDYAKRYKEFGLPSIYDGLLDRVLGI